jgi:hypothetical protein
MTSTVAKYAKLNGTSEFGSKSTNLMFPSDLLALDGQDQTCVTFFPNLIKNHNVSLSGSAALVQAEGALQSPYGEVPVIHTSINKGSILRDNGGAQAFSNLYSRSGESVTLPMPRSLEFSYSTNWANEELGAIAAGVDQVSDYEKLAGEGGVNLAKRLGANTIASVVNSLSGGKVKAKELLSLATGSVANNYAETMFKSVSNRTIPFSWNLTPRNSKEAMAIDSLLRMFRFHMLPEYKQNIGNGNAYLMYPSSFDIVFWLEGAPNPFIPRVGTCALTQMSINGTPNGQYISMIDGAPQSVTLSLTFMEMQTLSKDSVASPDMGTTF